ncbi:hypothetical protein [Litorimonas sp. WD9-15]|uniref:hypothetical protein n=1 Tax=Litorimonas sp. WD9-15 TaxID=3418716 RepID=UPI003D044256
MRYVYFIVISILALFTLSLTACAQSTYTSSCEEINGKPIASSLQEMIDQADFIGLFEVERYNSKSSEAPQANYLYPLYSYNLSLSKNIKGTSPKEYSIPVFLETKTVPPEYFYIKDIHQNLVKNDHLILGFSFMVEMKSGECRYSTTLVEGYEYLVFGGANSRSVYQPILDRRFDPLYRSVTALIKENGPN